MKASVGSLSEIRRGVLALGCAMAGCALSQIPRMPLIGYHSDGNAFVAYRYDVVSDGTFTGNAEFQITCVGDTGPLTNLSWKVPDLTGVSAPPGWDWSYNPMTDVLNLGSAEAGLEKGQQMSVAFTFTAAGRDVDTGWQEGVLNYVGAAAEGSLIVVEVKPLPVFSTAAFKLGAAGGAPGGSACTNCVALAVAFTSGSPFQVAFKSALTSDVWTALGTYTATGAVTVVTDTNASPCRYYRVLRQ